LILQLRAVRAHVGRLAGHTLAFDDETKALYDAVSPHLTPADLDLTLAQLNDLLPGSGELNPRLSAYNKDFESRAKNSMLSLPQRLTKHVPVPENISLCLSMKVFRLST